MKSPLKIGLNLLALGLISMGIYHANRVEAINNRDEGWQMESTWEIDTLEWCVSVVNPTGQIIHIPTQTWTEWNAFKSSAPSKGISLGACAPPSTTTTWDSGDGGDGSSSIE